MKTKMRTFTLLALAGGLALAGFAGAKEKEWARIRRPVVQIALLLDTSNSMDGLIGQAKSQLWRIVNEFSHARQDGELPEVQVALFEYGNNGLSATAGYIRKVSDFTTDLDLISEKLFALRTCGGEEYCGWVIKDALDRLEWSSSARAYKAVFIAGNEPFTQGPMDYADSCRAAHRSGVIVNTIFCGNEREGVETMWRDGARLGEGKFLVIDQDRACAYIEAPQDKELARLGGRLNETYLAYGAAGGASANRQMEQDRNAVTAAPAAPVERAVAKAAANYRNGAWDLVDAAKDKSFNLGSLKKEDLPAPMQALPPAERKEFVEKKSKERAELQAQIESLNEARMKFVAAKMKETAATNTLDRVVITTVREQARTREFRFE
ncbi:MAG: VWA domain-containing protein [Verrucomicrobia bacterium]|nr:VWA domain-containing protein [Verrucomicrobiota bacterium]